MRQGGILVDCSLSIECIWKPCYLTLVCGSFCPLHSHCTGLSRGIIVHSCDKRIVGGIGPVEFLLILKKGDAWRSGGRKNVRCLGQVRCCNFDSSPPCTCDTLDRSFHPHLQSHARFSLVENARFLPHATFPRASRADPNRTVLSFVLSTFTFVVSPGWDGL